MNLKLKQKETEMKKKEEEIVALQSQVLLRRYAVYLPKKNLHTYILLKDYFYPRIIS